MKIIIAVISWLLLFAALLVPNAGWVALGWAAIVIGIWLAIIILAFGRGLRRLWVVIEVELKLKNAIAEFGLLAALAVCLAGFLRATLDINPGAIAWLVIGLPISVMLGRCWWKYYR